MKLALIIPARYESSRFPGKPLISILGKSMIKRVYEQCVQTLPPEKVFVATDDVRIADHCSQEGMQVVMTNHLCMTGTDRVYAASQKIQADIYINVQGDEPLILPEDIRIVIDTALKSPGVIVNAMCQIRLKEDFRNPTIPKVVVDAKNFLLYMSRAAIPTNKNKQFVRAMKQVCIYAFPADLLHAFASVSKKTSLEEIEDIEILRFLEMGYRVKMVEVSGSSVAVDVPSDVLRVENEIYARTCYI